MTSDDEKYADAGWAFERYEQVRPRLPAAEAAGRAEARADLGEVAEHFDAFVFDSFGVLNVGEAPIEGAAARIADLRARGKQVLVLTNGATPPLAALPQKYADFGLDFTSREIVSSREVLASHLKTRTSNGPWLVVAPEVSEVDELGVPVVRYQSASSGLDGAGGVVFLSRSTIDGELMDLLRERLPKDRLPLLVGNPDLVAPRVDGFSLEPGSYAHQLADETGVRPEFFGKPFTNAFEAVCQRLEGQVPRHRIAMVGDTLHTDILGGAAAGFGTVLVTRHGVLKDLDVAQCIEQSQISPDFIVPHI